MAYSAHIVHKTNGRVRLQMDDPSISMQDMREALVQLQSLSMEQRVRGNPLTRTILVEDSSDHRIQEVLDKAQETGVIQLHARKEAPAKRTLATALHEMREGCDGFLRDVSDGRLDFKSGVALTMAGLGLKQSLSGKFLPAGLTLIFYAIGMLELEEMSRNKTSET